jgi:bifunctional ADP-heptose synthase (sugar kinase/adenylyltransferase)
VLARAAGCRYALVTRGDLGMALFGVGLPSEGTSWRHPEAGRSATCAALGIPRRPCSPCHLPQARSAPEAMVLANAAAGVVMLEQGAAVCSAEALEAALVGPAAPLVAG